MSSSISIRRSLAEKVYFIQQDAVTGVCIADSCLGIHMFMSGLSAIPELTRDHEHRPVKSQGALAGD